MGCRSGFCADQRRRGRLRTQLHKPQVLHAARPWAGKTAFDSYPLGISGPILRQRSGRSVPECHFSVNLPRFGGKPLRRNVYIANQNTDSPERYTGALNAALDMRRKAEEQYQVDATAAKRRAATRL